MSWPMQSTGPWGSGMPMGTDMNMGMGSYSAEQWTTMQQQNWQQWAQWQQQYAQWQSQYGEKYAQQMQAMQSMGAMPPLPPTNEPPPAPPPPDQPPPPPPHENNQPLYGTASSQPTPVPPPTKSRPASTNLTSANNTGNNQWSYGTDAHAKTASPAPAQPAVDSEALKKLAEEEKLFDIQFQKWEDEIDKWRQENVNHPDKQAYKEYEDKFEACRAQLMERRQQMKLKRARLTSNAQPANAPMTGNAPIAVPPPQHTPSNNYSQNKQQNYNNNQDTSRMNNNSTYQNQQYNNKQYNNASQSAPYGRGNDEAQDRFEPYQKMDDYSTNDNNYNNSYPSDNSTFLPASGAPKSIPGLDLVLETDRAPPKQQEVIDITEEQKKANYNQSHQQRKGPDLSSISKGINSILGDEKIMNILSMVRGQATDSPAPQQTENMPYNTNQNYQNNQMNNQWNRNENDYNQQYDNRQNNMPYNNRQEPNYSMQQNKDQFRFPPPNQNRMYDERPPNMQNQYNNENSEYGSRDMPQRNEPPPVRHNAPPPKPLMDLPIQMNNNFRGPPERRMPENVRPPSPPRPKWVEEPLFNPSLIVEYEHKPLRLKARDFIEPVHMFDYNHISKNNDKNKKDFEREADEVFLRKPRRDREDDYTSQDRYARDQYSRDFERRVPREDAREMRDDYRYKPPRNDHDDRRRPDDRYDERRRDDRYTRRDDNFTRRDDNFPRRVDNFPKRDDNFSRRDDNFAKRDDNFARRDDNFPRRDDNIPRRDDNFTRRDENFPRREDSFTRREDSLRDRDRERERERDRDVHRDKLREFSRRDDERAIPRSTSRDKDSRKREHSKESPSSNDSKKSKESSKLDQPKHIVMIDDILESPGREIRPKKIVIILRGPPGSGKSYLAKLIRDREAEYGGAARIMSIDDYFMQEGEVEENDPTTGKMVKKPTLKYEYDAELEESYLNSLKRAFKRSLTDGYFTFLIYDAVNDHLKSYADVWNFARQNGFQVYICTMELDPQTCFKRNIHNRTLEDIEVVRARFFDTPPHHIALDATTLLQSAAITHVHMEDADDVIVMEDADTEVESVFTSKWEKMDDASQLARLDGTSKPLRSSQLSMEDYLQLDDWTPSQARPGKKTVRWADIEERREQEKMRAIGFVVGQTDWNRMTDPTMGSSALTQTKYIERVRRT